MKADWLRLASNATCARIDLHFLCLGEMLKAAETE
jgi:hypothetical protein